MNRRAFLQYATTGGTVIAVAGGITAERAFASSQLTQKLVNAATPVLTSKAHTEFQSIPVKGREAIRKWFHGKALKVAPFVQEVCSNGFREKLHACGTEADQHRLLLVAFFAKVATVAEILNRVQVIAEEIGQELDLNWAECCKAIANEWNIPIRKYKPSENLQEFTNRVEKTVNTHLDETLQLARVGSQFPGLGETVGKMGQTALLLLPMSRIAVNAAEIDVNPLAIPAFVLLGLNDLFQYISGLFRDPRPDLQLAISGHLSLLGNRLGAEGSNTRPRTGNAGKPSSRLTEASGSQIPYDDVEAFEIRSSR